MSLINPGPKPVLSAKGGADIDPAFYWVWKSERGLIFPMNEKHVTIRDLKHDNVLTVADTPTIAWDRRMQPAIDFTGSVGSDSLGSTTLRGAPLTHPTTIFVVIRPEEDSTQTFINYGY